MGNDYMVTPDVAIYRKLVSGEKIRETQAVVDDSVCKMADLRETNGGLPTLHASISAKWAMCNDRAQNCKTEVPDLIRNRKGHRLYIVAGEPFSGNLESWGWKLEI